MVVPTADASKVKANCQMRVYVSRPIARCGPPECEGIVRRQQIAEEFCCGHGFLKVEIQQKEDDCRERLVMKGKRVCLMDWIGYRSERGSIAHSFL